MDDKPLVTRTIVVGVDIPFWSLVRLLVKYTLASIPAILIVVAAFGIIAVVLTPIATLSGW